MKPCPFEILDSIGSPRYLDVHCEQKVIAYETGNGVLLWDLEMDKKVRVHRHKNDVQGVMFGGDEEEKFLISVDAYSITSLYVTEWAHLRNLEPLTLGIPTKKREKPLQSVLITQLKKLGRILIIENENEATGAGYRLSIIHIKHGQQQIVEFQGQLDKDQTCLSASVLQSDSTFKAQYSMQLAIAEKLCLKLFTISLNNSTEITLTNRIHIKDPILGILSNSSFNLFLVNTHSGNILLINQTGEVVNQIHHNILPFVSMVALNENLLCGANNGTLCLYNISTGKLLKETPFDCNISKNSFVQIPQKSDAALDSFKERNNHDYATNVVASNRSRASIQQTKSKGPAVCNLRASLNGNLVVIQYSDGSTIAENFSKDNQTAERNVIHCQIGHTQRINKIQWENNNNRKRFFVASDDGRVSCWDFTGERWLPKMVGVSQTFDKSLSSSNGSSINDSNTNAINTNNNLNRPLNNNNTTLFPNSSSSLSSLKSSYRLQVKSLCLNSLKDELYCGDNKGNIFIFSTPSMRFITKYQISVYRIESMSLSAGGKYLGVYLSGGLAFILDTMNRFTPVAKLEDLRENEQFKAADPGILLIEDNLILKTKAKEGLNFDSLWTDRSVITGTTSIGGLRAKQMQQSLQYSDSRQLSLTVHSKCSLRIHSLQEPTNNNNTSRISNSFHSNPSTSPILSASSLSSLQPIQLTSIVVGTLTTQGSIQSFQIHPSKQYVLVLANTGCVYVFHLRSAQLRGTINVPIHSHKMSIDPSGLYLAVTSFGNPGNGMADSNNEQLSKLVNYQQQYTNNSHSFSQLDGSANISAFNPHKEIDLFFKKKPDLRPTRVLLFEIGTGNFAGEIQDLFSIESLQFSSDGRFLSIGSSRGIVSIWATCESVKENISETLEQMRLKIDFWKDYPLFLSPAGNNSNLILLDQANERQPEKIINLTSRSIAIGTNGFQSDKISQRGQGNFSQKPVKYLNENNDFEQSKKRDFDLMTQKSAMAESYPKQQQRYDLQKQNGLPKLDIRNENTKNQINNAESLRKTAYSIDNYVQPNDRFYRNKQEGLFQDDRQVKRNIDQNNDGLTKDRLAVFQQQQQQQQWQRKILTQNEVGGTGNQQQNNQNNNNKNDSFAIQNNQNLNNIDPPFWSFQPRTRVNNKNNNNNNNNNDQFYNINEENVVGSENNKQPPQKGNNDLLGSLRSSFLNFQPNSNDQNNKNGFQDENYNNNNNGQLIYGASRILPRGKKAEPDDIDDDIIDSNFQPKNAVISNNYIDLMKNSKINGQGKIQQNNNTFNQSNLKQPQNHPYVTTKNNNFEETIPIDQANNFNNIGQNIQNKQPNRIEDLYQRKRAPQQLQQLNVREMYGQDQSQQLVDVKRYQPIREDNDIPSASTLKRTEQSEDQYDQIEQFERRLQAAQ